MLVIFGGLPATGKSTIAKGLAAKRSAVYVRVDEIEQVLARDHVGDVGSLGYAIAQAIAESNLRLGLQVVADSVNPVGASREGWRNVAQRAGSPFLEVEVICSDFSEHRARAEGRVADIKGLVLPSWSAISEWRYEAWDSDVLVIDTARTKVGAAVAELESRIIGLLR